MFNRKWSVAILCMFVGALFLTACKGEEVEITRVVTEKETVIQKETVVQKDFQWVDHAHGPGVFSPQSLSHRRSQGSIRFQMLVGPLHPRKADKAGNDYLFEAILLGTG